jgi:hypothetical protein
MAIGTLTNLYNNHIAPLVQTASELATRVQQVTNKNPQAFEEAVSTGMLVGAGIGFGFLAGSLVSIGRNDFSLRTSLFYSTMGALLGTLASSPLSYRFFSQFKKREAGL